MGKKKSSPPPPPAPPPPPSPAEVARETVKAQIESIPKAAALQFDVLSDPRIGLQAQTQLLEDTRANVFPQLTDARQQLISQAVEALGGGTGLTADQEAAIGARRQTAQDELTEALRNRANLGGGLFGGRSAKAENRAVGELQQSFATEDINRQIQQRAFNQQLLLQAIQSLLPGAQITSPSFIDPVPSANVTSQVNLGARGQDAQVAQNAFNAQLEAQRQQSALQGALFSALGTTAGGLLGNQGLFRK